MVKGVSKHPTILFQDEKYLLKFHTGSGVVSGGGRDDAKKIHSPVIKSVPLAFCALYQMLLLHTNVITQVHNDAGETGGNKQARLLPHEHNTGNRRN